MAGPTFTGIIKDFCRDKGHGYIKPSDEGELMFLHISEYVYFNMLHEPKCLFVLKD